MAENIGGPSAPYNTVIPSITDNADIQTALRLYHYGSNTNAPGTIPSDSLAGHLTELENTKVDILPTSIPNAANLNSYITTGYYTQTNNSFAAAGTNYPESFAGLLTVVNDGAIVFQQYQVIGAAESGSTINPDNRTYWRFFIGASWKPWRTFIEQSDFASIGDGRYYTRTEANNLFTTQVAAAATYLTITAADARQYISENVVTGNYSLALSDVSKVVSVNNSATATITIPNSSSVDFPIGTLINVYAQTANTVFVSGAVGVTLRPTQTIQLFEQYTEISLRKRGTNEWVASGNILKV